MEQKKITFNRDLNKAMKFASQKALVENSDFITPEHLLYGMMTLPQMQDLMWSCNEAFDLDDFLDELDEHIEESTKDDSQGAKPNDICEPSFQLQQVFTDAVRQAIMAERKAIDMPMAINAILCLENSWAAYLLRKHANVEDFEIMTGTEIHFHERSTGVEEDDDQYSNGEGDNPFGLFDDDDEDLLFGDEDDFSSPSHKNDKWKKYVTCINEHLAEKNPLIGREKELDRTIQVLCRKDKNNPLHIGEPGVGKTALVYGVARRIEEGKVPDRLKGCNIYQLDMGTLLAGTRFRGDMEQRLKQIMEGVTSEAHCIIYLDEIHNIVGAGKGAEGGSDVSDLLKPYLDDDRIRVIGATTYTEYNKNFTRSVGMIRRFQTIDVEEPSIDEAIHILKSLKPIYEKYHHVKYDAAAIEYAVTSSAKFITDRFLPDKAIDIIDEAGAQAEMEGKKYKKIGKKQIAEVLAKVAKIDALAIKQDDNKNLASLESRMKDVIYGQDRAIQTVVEAVQLSKAGLTDENKPLASLLFVGPTGVGKTEVAKMLAQELGVKLVRFDMSEYVEKHTVAKLIGAPAGYVGYDDGGLLTDAVRKSPDCVLLLDEIEKAHSDIFNILLQVMDYGVLTDSKGRKAHFKSLYQR